LVWLSHCWQFLHILPITMPTQVPCILLSCEQHQHHCSILKLCMWQFFHSMQHLSQSCVLCEIATCADWETFKGNRHHKFYQNFMLRFIKW
jgi:hypothetical protein